MSFSRINLSPLKTWTFKNLTITHLTQVSLIKIISETSTSWDLNMFQALFSVLHAHFLF